MLKKLQIRFILSNMILVGIVLLICVSVIGAGSYAKQKNSITSSLRASIQAINLGNDNRPFSIGPRSEAQNNINISDMLTYTIRIDEQGNVLQTSRFNTGYMQEESVSLAVSEVLTAYENMGELSDLGVYYMKETETNNTTIVSFANASTIKTALYATVRRSIVVFLLGLVVLFIASYFLSKLVVKPVKVAWQQQQQFVADASHELKTPLTVILANNEIIQQHKTESIESQQKWLDSSKAEANHMKKLVDNLLYLARADANKEKPIYSEVLLDEEVLNTALQYEPVAFEKGVNLDYSDIDSDVRIQGDLTKIRQLVKILIDNACKYGENGSTVSVSLKGGLEPCFKVHNYGNPISPEDLPHLFERFYRSDKARTQDGPGGYGLGLAIAKSIVDEHEGKISVTSTATDGTTFYVVFKNHKSSTSKHNQ